MGLSNYQKYSITQHFYDRAKERCNQRDGKLVYDMYYDYRDNLSAEMIHEAFEKNKNETDDAMQAIICYLWEENPQLKVGECHKIDKRLC